MLNLHAAPDNGVLIHQKKQPLTFIDSILIICIMITLPQARFTC